MDRSPTTRPSAERTVSQILDDLEKGAIADSRPVSGSSQSSLFDAEKREALVQVKSASEATPYPTEPPLWKPSRSELLIMITLSVSSLMVALDATILVSVLPTLAVELHGTAAQAFWTGTAYLLTHSVLQPFLATLSDIFGRREILVPSILCFAVGSVICATAHGFTAMLVGRVIQGLGGAGIIALSQVMFADLVPLRQRPKYFTMVLGAWAVGSVLGPVVGALFAERVSWRWCFYLNLPISAISLPMAIFCVNLTTPKESLLTKLRMVDWTGGILFIGSLTSALVGIAWAGVQFPWSSWHTLIPLVLGSVVFVFSIAYERYIAKNPFLNPRVFNTWSAIASFSTATMQGLVLYMALYYLTFYFTSVHFFSAIRSGVSIMPATVLLLPGSAVVSALITRFARFRWAIWTGFVVSALATGLFIAFLNSTAKTPVWAVLLSIFGLGMGMILSSVNISIQAIVDPDDAGAAAACYAFMRSIGMTIGVAVGGTVFQNILKKKLIDLGLTAIQAAEISSNSEAYVVRMRALSPEDPGRHIVVQGYVSGFKGVWTVMCAVCVLGLLVSAFIKKGNLDKVLPQSRKVRTLSQSD